MTTKVTVKGHLARDPAKKTINGKEYVEVVVLSNEGYYDKDKAWVNTSRNDFSILFNASYADKNGISSMKSGDHVQADGSLSAKPSQKDGVAYANLTLRSPRLSLIPKAEESADTKPAAPKKGAAAPDPDVDEMIPF